MSRRQITRDNSLARYGVITAAVYLLTLIFYRKGPEVRSRTAREVFAWFFCLTLLFLFWKGYQQISRVNKPTLRLIVGFATLFCLLAFLIVPFHSTDVFGYINRGWQQVHYGQNPYVYLAMILPLALLMEDDHWLRRLVILITGTELLSLTFFKQAYMLNYFAMIVIPAWIVFRQKRKGRTLAETTSPTWAHLVKMCRSTKRESLLTKPPGRYHHPTRLPHRGPRSAPGSDLSRRLGG